MDKGGEGDEVMRWDGTVWGFGDGSTPITCQIRYIYYLCVLFRYALQYQVPATFFSMFLLEVPFTLRCPRNM